VDRGRGIKVLAQLLVLKGWCFTRRYGIGGRYFDQGAHCGDGEAVDEKGKEKIETKKRRLRSLDLLFKRRDFHLGRQ
jgi:hypothetical protein